MAVLMISSRQQVEISDHVRNLWREKLSPASQSMTEQVNGLTKIERVTFDGVGRKGVAHLAYPKNSTGRLPCVIWIRGGYKDFGAWNMYQYFAFLGRLAAEGYCVIAPNLPGSPGTEGHDEYGGDDLRDVAVLRDLLAQLPMADIARIGVVGVSRGGMMALMTARKESWIRTMLLVAPITDLYSVQRSRPEFRPLFEEAFGGSDAEMTGRSAIRWVKDLPAGVPITVLHGTTDDRVAFVDSERFVSECVSAGKNATLLALPGEGHGLLGPESKNWTHVVEWAASLRGA